MFVKLSCQLSAVSHQPKNESQNQWLPFLPTPQTSLPDPLSHRERGRKAKKPRHDPPISGARASLPSYFEQPLSFTIKVLLLPFLPKPRLKYRRRDLANQPSRAGMPSLQEGPTPAPAEAVRRKTGEMTCLARFLLVPEAIGETYGARISSTGSRLPSTRL